MTLSAHGGYCYRKGQFNPINYAACLDQVSIQGFHSCACCDYDCDDITQLVPVTLFQCKNPCTGVSFTNCLNGLPNGNQKWDTYYGSKEFVILSSFSNLSIIGLNDVCKVGVENYISPCPPCGMPCGSVCCSVGPTVQGTPLGKIKTHDSTYIYSTSNDCFKLGPIHLGVDNWLQAIPNYSSHCKENIETINVSNSCRKCDCKPYEIYKTPLQLKITFYFNCKKPPLCINLCLYFLAKEGICTSIKKIDCHDSTSSCCE